MNRWKGNYLLLVLEPDCDPPVEPREPDALGRVYPQPLELLELLELTELEGL